MKGGVAVALALAATVPAPTRDVTYVFYECEEVEAALQRAAGASPRPIRTARRRLRHPHGAVRRRHRGGLPGHAARRGRTWRAGARTVPGRGWAQRDPLGAARSSTGSRTTSRGGSMIDGLEYREGLNAVGITGGVAGNVIPDECVVTVNYRFAPSLTPEQAERHVRRSSTVSTSRIVDVAAGALPGLSSRPAPAFLAVRGAPRGRSSAGPTWRGSPPWASPRSTTGRAIPRWRTRATSTFRPTRCARPSRSCAPGSWRRSRAVTRGSRRDRRPRPSQGLVDARSAATGGPGLSRPRRWARRNRHGPLSPAQHRPKDPPRLCRSSR